MTTLWVNARLTLTPDHDINQSVTPHVIAADQVAAEQFGFEDPDARLSFVLGEGEALTIVLGTRNPPQTAVYARRQGASEVVLLGLNVPYYLDLALDAATAGRR